jgi:DNA-binding NarL/FixJ family response regulator
MRRQPGRHGGERPVTSVMIADADARMRGVLHRLVAAAHGFELMAEVASLEGAVAAARKEQPLLVLMDVRMLGLGGAEAAGQMTRESPSTVVVLISTDPRGTRHPSVRSRRGRGHA